LLREDAPFIHPADAVAVGFRDGQISAREGSQPLPQELVGIDLRTLRERGAEQTASDAIAILTRPGGPEGFWVHLDADVLDDAVMPAVDYRLEGGLSTGELETILQTAMASERLVGLEVTIYNPTLDPTLRAGHTFATALARGLANAQSVP
jgi:arginase